METEPTDYLEEVLRCMSTGGVKDPVLLKKIREEAQKVTDEIYRKHGLLNIATELIREVRDE